MTPKLTNNHKEQNHPGLTSFSHRHRQRVILHKLSVFAPDDADFERVREGLTQERPFDVHEDRAVASMVAMALGDAIGAPVEFLVGQ